MSFSELLPIEGLPFSFMYGRRSSLCLLDDWDFDTKATMTGRILIWTDPGTGLQVRADVTEYWGAGAVEWVLTFTNAGHEPTPILEDVLAVRARLPHSMGWRSGAWLHRLSGASTTEGDWALLTKQMAPGSWARFSSEGGKPSRGAFPFFNLQWDGGGVITALGWTGQWKVAVPWGTMAEIRGGMDRMHLYLLPGESIRTPSVMQMWWGGNDLIDSYNKFRQLLLERVFPRVDEELVQPPIAHLSTAAYEWNDSNEESTLSHLEAVKDLGFEVFWMDAYYFGNGGFPSGIGNYRFPVTSIAPPERFPNGLSYIADEVHAAGMEWLVWYDFQRVSPGTHLDQDRPEWLLSAPGRDHKLLNLGLPEAREFMTRYLIESVSEHKMDWLRMDPCTDLMPFWRATDTPGRVGMTEIRYVEGLYQLLDDLMEAHPRLKIDNCGGGGKLIDLEMCKRATPLWRTDFTTPYQETTRDFDMGAVYMQAMIAALDLYTPFHACGGFSELPYHWRSGATTGIGILEDMRGEFYPREVVKAAIRETKRLRKYRTGNYYPPGAITRDPAGWHIFQYHRPGHDDGLVVAFRRHKSKSPEFTRLLMEIDLDGTYEVYRYYDYIFRQHDIMGGRELQLLHLVIEERPGSLVVEYRKVVDAD